MQNLEDDMGTDISTKLDQILAKLNTSDITISNTIFNPPDNNCLLNDGWTSIIINHSGTSSYGDCTFTTDGNTIQANIRIPQTESGLGLTYHDVLYNKLLNLASVSKMIVYISSSFTAQATKTPLYFFLMDKTTPFEIIKTGYAMNIADMGSPMKETMPLSEYVITEFNIPNDQLTSNYFTQLEIDISDYNDNYYLGFQYGISQYQNGLTVWNNTIEQIRFE